MYIYIYALYVIIQLSYLHVKHEPNDITMIAMMIMAINLLMMEISRKFKLVLIHSYILMPAKKENITIRTILVALRRHVVIRLYYASSLADEIGGQHSSPQNWCQDMQTWSQNPTCKFDVNSQICLLRPVGRNLSLQTTHHDTSAHPFHLRHYQAQVTGSAGIGGNFERWKKSQVVMFTYTCIYNICLFVICNIVICVYIYIYDYMCVVYIYCFFCI